ncbi:hypothetical protein DC498_02055 [Terrimonas sp.]|nr:hypothetical protein DC498_02055 [Terrimonas sp.]
MPWRLFHVILIYWLIYDIVKAGKLLKKTGEGLLKHSPGYGILMAALLFNPSTYVSWFNTCTRWI